MLEFFALATCCLAVPLLALVVVTRFVSPSEGTSPTLGRAIGPTGWEFLDEALSRLRFWPAVAVCGLSALVFMTLASHNTELPVMLTLALLALLFFRAWREEFVRLMGLHEDSFPGRFDKLIWISLMIILPPVGYTCLRAYRRSLQPEAETTTETDPEAKPVASPAHEWF